MDSNKHLSLAGFRILLFRSFLFRFGFATLHSMGNGLFEWVRNLSRDVIQEEPSLLWNLSLTIAGADPLVTTGKYLHC